MPDISLRGVRKSYGKQQVLLGIDLAIPDGTFAVILGPSGCGKSTLLRMIAGLEAISVGEIAIAGRVVNRLEPRERGCAMVFQNYALYPHMTVAENIGYALKVAGVGRAERSRRVAEVAQSLALTPFLDRRPAQLSGGQRQRVAMGRAMIRAPGVFLYDEPLSNLDAKLRVQMRAEIRKLHMRLGATTVFVTHDQVEAMTLADRVVVMNQGRIEQVGPPQELYHNPQTRFVAGFIGSPAMNFFKVHVFDEGGLKVKLGEGSVLDVPPQRFNRYAAYKGRDMTLGIRPEHLTELHDIDKTGIGRLDITVDVTEPMGMETMVHFFLNGEPATARIDPGVRAEPGETLPLAVNMNQMHLLEPESGKVV